MNYYFNVSPCYFSSYTVGECQLSFLFQYIHTHRANSDIQFHVCLINDIPSLLTSVCNIYVKKLQSVQNMPIGRQIDFDLDSVCVYVHVNLHKERERR